MSQQRPDTLPPRGGLSSRILDGVERVGNRLPDPAALFLILMLLVWALSWLLSGVEFSAVNPATGEPIRIVNLLSGESLTAFMANLYRVFMAFAPLGVVLTALAAKVSRRPLIIIAMDVYPEVLIAHGLVSARSLLGRVLRAVFDWSYRSAARVVSLGPVMTRRLGSKTSARCSVASEVPHDRRGDRRRHGCRRGRSVARWPLRRGAAAEKRSCRGAAAEK